MSDDDLRNIIEGWAWGKIAAIVILVVYVVWLSLDPSL